MILSTPSDRPPCRPGAVDPTRTGLAILHGDLALHDLMGAVSHGGRPAETGIATGARGLLRLPIDWEVTHSKPWCGLRLPLTIGAHGPEPLHAGLTRAGDQPFSGEIARLDARRGGHQTLPCARLMAVRGGRTMADGPSRGLHRRDEVGCIVLAGLGEMDVIPPLDVVCFVPYHASTSAGELINRPDGGLPAWSVR